MAEPQSTVEYRLILGCSGYRVGRDGSLWSCWRSSGGTSRKQIICDRWRRLKGEPRKEDGRLRYTIRRDGGTYRRAYGSHFVLEAFVGPCPAGMEACHNDGNCLNDSEANLRWDTPGSNRQDKQKHGTQPRGEQINTAKLTADDVRAIRAEGGPLKKHAQRYGISATMVSLILRRKAWQHVA